MVTYGACRSRLPVIVSRMFHGGLERGREIRGAGGSWCRYRRSIGTYRGAGLPGRAVAGAEVPPAFGRTAAVRTAAAGVAVGVGVGVGV